MSSEKPRESHPPEERAAADDAPGNGADFSQEMIRRLRRALEYKLHDVEQRMERERRDGADAASAADQERDTRTLGALTRLLEKITALSEAADAARGARETDPKAEAADAERRREQIAERIARLRESGAA